MCWPETKKWICSAYCSCNLQSLALLDHCGGSGRLRSHLIIIHRYLLNIHRHKTTISDSVCMFQRDREGENGESTVVHADNENVRRVCVCVCVCSLMLLVSISSELFASTASRPSCHSNYYLQICNCLLSLAGQLVITLIPL